MEEKTWYLGPLGDLRELVCPEPNIVLNQVRYGGSHQGLSGARTMDVTGTKMEYQFNFDWLDQAEYRWLEALNTRMVPGPFYLIDPMKKNRLSVAACKMTRPLTEYPSMNYALAWDRPAALDLPIQSMNIKSWAAYPVTLNIRFDRGYVTPVVPGEVVTASLWTKSSAATTGRLYFDYLDATGGLISSYFETKSTVTSWQRISFTRTIPANAHAVRFYYQPQTRTQLWFAAPQIESGPDLTSWEVGGAANTVLLDSLDTSSRIFPLRNCKLTLLEA